MKWLNKIWYKIKFLIGKILTKFRFGSNHKPRAKIVVDYDLETNEIIGLPYYIIVNHNGETLNSPIFSTLEEANAWIEKYLIEQEKLNTPQ